MPEGQTMDRKRRNLIVTGLGVLAVMVSALCPMMLAAQVNGAGTAVTGEERKPLGQPAYTVHAGDALTVNFRFTPEFNDDVIVQPDGEVNLKSTGELRVAGYTVPEIERRIALESASKLVNPEITVSLKDFERPHFVVAGEVQTPGKFELRHATTALQAILLAGGPKEDSAMNHVYLFRRLNSDEAEVHILQLSRYDGHTRAKNDLVLQPDDMILVQRDALEKIGRIVKLFNIGLYLNPIPQTGLF
jgi:polysaccharide export outer membrane protein